VKQVENFQSKARGIIYLGISLPSPSENPKQLKAEEDVMKEMHFGKLNVVTKFNEEDNKRTNFKITKADLGRILVYRRYLLLEPQVVVMNVKYVS
jgi:hypothetical protein